MPETGRVAPGAAPCGRAEWAPRVPSAALPDCSPRTAGPQPRDVLRLALRAAFGRVGDGARSHGVAPGDRTRPPRAWCVHEFSRSGPDDLVGLRPEDYASLDDL